MPNISQLEIENVTYDFADLALRNNFDSEVFDWLGCGITPVYESSNMNNPQSNLVRNHATLRVEENNATGQGGVGFGTGNGDSVTNSYVFNEWADTGNLRIDKYDWTNSTRTALGYFPLMQAIPTNQCVKTTSGSNVFFPADGWTLAAARAVQWGQVVQIYLSLKNTSEISVTASGNISNIVVGNIVKEFQPKQVSAIIWSVGDGMGQAWGYITPSTDSNPGAVAVGAFGGTGAAYTIAADNNLYLYSIYLLSMENFVG